MVLPRFLTTNIKKAWPILLGIVVVALMGYYMPRIWREFPEVFHQMPAALEEAREKEEGPEERLKLEELPIEMKEAQVQKKHYREVAGKGEGLTHLARRALKKYLSEHPQNFTVTPEHKIYIEDYIAKSLGYRWLKLGEEVEFSEDLIQEALSKAETLSPSQLQNLSQYVPLVASSLI